MTRGMRRAVRFRNLLMDPLMRSSMVEVCHILIEHALELPLVKDRIGSWRMIRRFENLNRTCCRHASKARPKFAIVITNQILRRLPIRGSFSEVLREPGIGRRSCHSYMDHLP